MNDEVAAAFFFKSSSIRPRAQRGLAGAEYTAVSRMCANEHGACIHETR